MNIKTFFKIVGTTVGLFCIIATFILTAIFFINPGLLKNAPFFGRVLTSFSPPDKPLNVLILGVDKVSGNTDVIVVVNVNPKSKKINLLSIPRDTKVKYNGKNHKVNSMYAKGNEAAKDTVGEIIGQKIDYVLAANPEGFRNIIDILGGVEVDIPQDMNYDDYDQNLHIHLKKGHQVLDGNKAEQFVRYRQSNNHNDVGYYAKGDLGRIEAQQKIFFKAFVEQKIKPGILLKAEPILQQIFKHVKTDMPISEAIRYTLYTNELKPENVKFLMLPGKPKRTSAWYYIHDPEETQKLIDENFNDTVSAQ